MIGIAVTPPPAERLQTRIVHLPLSEVRLLEGHENARYMKAAQFQKLVANLERDGVLTSTPLIYKGVVRSGNHRVQAARKAGLVDADFIELLGEYPEERILAIQLAHNAINGEDDPNILNSLWQILPFEEKRYSGLSDDLLGKVKELDVKALGGVGPAYEEIQILFLPDDAAVFADLVKKLEKRARKPPVLCASKADFDRVFDTLVSVKERLNIHNTALAMKLMAELANERLEQMADVEGEPRSEAPAAA